MYRLLPALSLLIATLVLSGCQPSTSTTRFNRFFDPKPLRVGMTLDAPPLTYKKESNAAGLEMKFASGLAHFVERRLEVVAVSRDNMATALLNRQVDILMTGLSVADARRQNLLTADPYLLSGQIALMRLDGYALYGTGSQHLVDQNVRLGVVKDSNGDTLVKKLGARGKIVHFASATEAADALIAGHIDVFLSDLPTSTYYAAQYIDKGLTPGSTLLTKEPLAWAVHPQNDKLLAAANNYLASLEQSGELQKILEQEIPFYRNTVYSLKQ
ncbi:substrate-binding periplasmic protein [Desulfobulbus oligotrophicus]|jgi:polar amino acid transport system substrate-binding protein|uniref:Amino acid ABC transporter substrate-binding protein n=1 Tax=Desulfobulbus oligotrophicus TaxID=1909699 RepID=A0A7T6ARF5_9BACT|nr:transporter substrate-binding domain-containing protein [Desulfobulbus oligotrophicus]MDY0389940.1 transporter substrate-binding domain-containing protein [Desulfobulbus oligotrophicus]QQG66803.1 amino acid ABC transporter substrate-binding protein [Desulfobulbus oligotrophicus]